MSLIRDYKKYRVRVKDSSGDLHLIMCYGHNEREAKINGLREAIRLLQDPKVEIQWTKEV